MDDDILIAIDGRERMTEVMDEALVFAELCGATVHGLYVIGNQANRSAAGAKWFTFGERRLATPLRPWRPLPVVL
ncbi:hypothetical protein BRC68_11085 [Halobacteriales archaeon QH_6_64_20]|jgi:nucleotide-binding universal stress UspA family protein|nr:MAG: hypothetical protein BRC68_11085 [Halobacteriales archaeon QH_6_64_20]